MAKYLVETESGKYEVETETQGTTQLATSEPLMTSQERLSGGFMGKESLKSFQEERRAERGLEEGTPLEPTGFNY